MSGLGLDISLLLALKIDCPNVNKSLKSKLGKELRKRGATYFLDVVMLYSHGKQRFFRGYQMFERCNVNVDQFAIHFFAMHFCFNLPAVRREDYRGVSEATDVIMHYVMKHCQTRWLSVDKVLVRIIEQYENLKEYFLKTPPTLPGFKGKNEVNQTERYQRIRNVLTSKTALAYMSFIVHVSQDCNEFVVPL